MEPIDVLGVELIRAFQSLGQRGLASRRRDKMDVLCEALHYVELSVFVPIISSFKPIQQSSYQHYFT